MKRNLLHTFVLCSAMALASCSTTNKVASTQKVDDDVYFSKAEAGEAPVYRQPVNEDRYVAGTSGDDDDYYYYDSYASRINRFGYASPFDYYDSYYYGYSPYAYNSPYGYGGWGLNNGWNLGIGLGYGYGYGGWGMGYGYGGYGYNPWGYGLGYGYGGFYSPYSYWGTGYGYGGGYWGLYSANNVVRYNNPRPARVSNTSTGSIIYRGAPGRNTPTFVPNRPSRIYGTTNTTRTGDASGRASRIYTPSNNNGDQQSRGVYRPAAVERPAPSYTPPPSNSGGGGGRSSGGSSGGGGGRPARP